MYRSFTIKNFRSFREFTLDQLERVNLIAGKNDVGKTALLEGIFLQLAPNRPELALTINGFRGIEQIEIDPEEIWGWLFFDKQIAHAIELSSVSDTEQRRLLSIRLVEADTSRVSTSHKAVSALEQTGEVLATATSTQELQLEYHDPAGLIHTSRASITADGIQYQNARLGQLAPGLFLIARGRYRNQDAERFSRMERVGHEADILSVMQELEPRLRRLSVLVTGGVPMIHGDIGIGQLVPVPMMGEGFGRLLSIVLAIATSQQGTVLIDEIENGLHHSVLADTWKAIGRAARQADVQIFATTHSWECIRAAHQAFESNHTYDFRLHRLERVDDETQDISYDREALDAAIEFGLETR